jgi:hypothetical protein
MIILIFNFFQITKINGSLILKYKKKPKIDDSLKIQIFAQH